MGRSITIHCIGQGPIERIDETSYRRREYHAMNRTQIKQEIEKARRRGQTITEWYAQTKTGCKILGDAQATHWPVLTSNLILPATVICPVCHGEGYRMKSSDFMSPFCVVCNGSGICKKDHEKRWQPWQIERMKSEFELKEIKL